MKRTLLALALASAVAIAPVALAMPAIPGHGNDTSGAASTSPPGKSGTTTTSPPDTSGATTTSSPGKSGAAVASFVLRGTVTGAPTGASFTVTLKGTNGLAKKALKGATSFVVLTDAKTRFSKAGEGAATFVNIAANDRVVVTIRAKRSTDAAGLALVAASRVVDKGPKSASFVLRGTVTGAPTGASFTVTLKGTNAHAKKALKGATSFVVLTDAKTRFSKAGEGSATFANIAANDRVVVTIRANRSTDAAGLALVAASRVVDKGPKPA